MEAVAEVTSPEHFILSNVACPTGRLTLPRLADSNFEVPRVTLYLRDMVTVTFS